MEEELEVLEAILGDAIHVEKEALKLTIKVKPMPLPGQVNKIRWQSDKLTEEKVEAEVENIPPVMLLVQLSPSYPALAPPDARVMSDWLPLEEISKLERLLGLQWERAGGQVVIWDWVQEGGGGVGFTFPPRKCKSTLRSCCGSRCNLKTGDQDKKFLQFDWFDMFCILELISNYSQTSTY